MQRYPLQPLADAEHITLGTPHGAWNHGQPDPGAPLHGTALLAARLDVHQRTVQRAITDGLTEAKADVWATTLGHHPAYIWPDLWPTHDDHALDDVA